MEEILNALDKIERDHDVFILHAVESGSRLWRIYDDNSDYDIRFVYSVRPEFYYSLRQEKDTIERKIEVNGMTLDLSGWEIRKALRLLLSGNAQIAEWLYSDIVYRQEIDIDPIVDLINIRNLIPAYCGLAKSHVKKYLQKGVESPKKYLYTVRSIMMAMWIDKYNKFPPLNFHELRNIIVWPEVNNSIDYILEMKAKNKNMTDIELQLWIEDMVDKTTCSFGFITNNKWGKAQVIMNELVK